MSYRASLAAVVLLATMTPLVPAEDRPNAGAVPALEGSRPGEDRDDNALKMRFCWCPKGTFRMGSPADEPDRQPNEGPVNVTLSQGFWMGKFEVTQDEWRRVMGTSLKEKMRERFDDLGPLVPVPMGGEGPNYPMYLIDHLEAETFCIKLTETERRAGRLPSGWSYRLPTEAQWEYACRAGTTSATAFGNSLSSEQANFNGDEPYNGAAKGPFLEKTTPVGHYKRANAWGLLDMHGNVMEWCRDGYTDQLPGGVDPLGPPAATERVVRGGCWFFLGWACRSAAREKTVPSNNDLVLGFRVARVPSGPGVE